MVQAYLEAKPKTFFYVGLPGVSLVSLVSGKCDWMGIKLFVQSHVMTLREARTLQKVCMEKHFHITGEQSNKVTLSGLMCR